MNPERRRAITAALVILAAVATMLFPAPALAAQPEMRLADYATVGTPTTRISGVAIGDVERPKAGEALDDEATVTTAEGQSWDIPVIWLDTDLQVATTAQEGRSYLPALAFFLPQGYAPSDADETGAFVVSFSDELRELFCTDQVISVFDDATGITYILPSSLRSFFGQTPSSALPSHQEEARETPGTQTSTSATTSVETTSIEETPSTTSVPETTNTQSALARLVDIYCAQTAKDALSQDDLEYLVDLIVNRLQPQAVNLLREKFPAFDNAAACGEIGTRIGLYIYYGEGDNDGDEAHTNLNPSSLAYVIGRPTELAGDKTFVYILGVNAKYFSPLDDNGQARLDRDGEGMDDLRNTLVHELFHAYMDDYNRAGMIGATSNDNLVFSLSSVTEEQATRFHATRFPQWFIEGTASSVENNYQFRLPSFNLLRASAGGYATGSQDAIFYNYLTATKEGTPVGFHLMFASGNMQQADSQGNMVSVNPTMSRYVSGYLAVLYLSELAAASSDEIGSSMSTVNGSTTFSSEKIRAGLNLILERSHAGETLDEIIADISKDKSGTSRYASTDDFQSKFICGPVTETSAGASYASDPDSLAFVANFLAYMDAISSDTTRANIANGSILFDFDRDFAAPLDIDEVTSTDVLTIVENNSYVESTVPNSAALATGGKSYSGASGHLSAASSDAIAGEESAEDASTVLAAAKATADLDATPEAAVVKDNESEATPDEAAVVEAEPQQADSAADAESAQAESTAGAESVQSESVTEANDAAEPVAEPAAEVDAEAESASEPMAETCDVVEEPACPAAPMDSAPVEVPVAV